jgi:hypothetical protein
MLLLLPTLGGALVGLVAVPAHVRGKAERMAWQALQDDIVSKTLTVETYSAAAADLRIRLSRAAAARSPFVLTDGELASVVDYGSGADVELRRALAQRGLFATLLARDGPKSRVFEVVLADPESPLKGLTSTDRASVCEGATALMALGGDAATLADQCSSGSH